MMLALTAEDLALWLSLHCV